MTEKAIVLNSVDIRSMFMLLDTPRNRALFAIGLYTGLRISDIIALPQAAVFTASRDVRSTIVLKRSKKKIAVHIEIPIHDNLAAHLSEHRATLPFGTWLFPSRSIPEKHISRIQAHSILSTAFKQLKREGASTHSMRRTFLVSLVRAGVPKRMVHSLSGLSTISQLRDYRYDGPFDTNRAMLCLDY